MPNSNAIKGFPNRSVKTAPKFKGGSAIARMYGVTPTTISMKMRRGMTADEIHAFYKAQGLGPKGPGRPKVGDGYKPVVYQGANKHAPKQSNRPVNWPVNQPVSRPTLPPPPPTPDETEDQDDGWFPGSQGENEFATLNHAKIRKEVALADKHELDLAERRKELIDRQKVKLFTSGMITRARDTFLRIAPELRDRLAATTSPIECERLLSASIKQALAVLSDYNG